ncbi:SMC family ATPase [Gordonia sp. CPCC 206044]|uniref:AAA family ATPase n=1 Tax=Gordonia sp. CPCC 206044 TaxID=3140793 RepID=UPI003AF3DD0D
MRLHRLRIRAFGPFADEIEIDVDSVSSDGLFLLHGQTGAGKTTILDAVAFALYGRVPGARDTNRRLHSDHATAEVTPEVELEATIGGRRLCLTRSPDHHRPKKRGTGTTKVNARACLVWVDGSGPDLTRLPEIGEAVVRLLGMSAEQFFQVVLLPQGEFARFLRATSEDRELLLERLFDTERFGEIEEWLRERARRSASALEERATAVDRIAGQIVAVAGVPTPAVPDMDWAQACLDAARDDAARARGELAAVQAEVDRVQAAHEHGRRIAELRRRGAEAQTRLERLDREQSVLTEAAQALRAARRAAPIAPVADDHDQALAAAELADQLREHARAELRELPDTAHLCETDDGAALETAIEQWITESGRWEPLARRESQRPGLVAEMDELTEHLDHADRRIAALRTHLDAAPQRRAEILGELADANEARARIPQLTAERERLDTLAAAMADRDRLAEPMRKARQHLDEAREAHLTARSHLLDLRETRLAGMAVELANQLADGEPCVVCGSTTHPAPAGGAEGDRVSEADETAAGETEQRAAAAVAQAGSGLATLTERHANLTAVIGTAGPREIEADRTRIADRLVVATRASERVGELERRISAVDAEVERWRAELGELESTRSGRRERLTGLRSTLAELDADIAEATGGRIGVAQRRDDLAELCRRARRLRETGQDAARARRRVTDLAERLGTECASAGFDDVHSARSAAASEEQIAEWESALAQAASLRSGAQEILSDDEVVGALAAESVDVAALADELTTTRQARDAATRRNAVAAHRLTDLEGFVGQFWAAADALAPLQARHAELHGLAELVSGRGQNSRRMSLRSYVLAARLEEVLVAASARLRQMSSGRYEFVHSDAAGPRGRRGGLGIEVIDEYTGVVRATTTLSGGETFFASLALALGLADVVSAESGGRILDTIFIDEGFGTLDPEALDLVMGVLDDLRSGGRVVGVVSHVGELQERIPAQVHVVRAENGSHVWVRGAVGVS